MTRVLVTDESLAELCDELAGRMHAGESLDAENLPESLRDLLPALHALVEVRASGACQRPDSVGGDRGVDTPRSPDPMLGKLGDFRLLREIGRGGMGVVYEAEQISLGRRVALKVLPFAAALNPRQLQRFRAEAQAAASLHHSNIVPVFAVGCEQGVHYYAMQIIDGQTLADAVAQTRRIAGLDGIAASPDSTVLAAPVPLSRDTGLGDPEGGGRKRHGDAEYFRRIAELGAQAAAALDYAHELGVVHRDIKPANLMVDDRGQLWVTDFGLVRYAHDAGLTVSGELVGTLRYMSPEQTTAKRGVVDHRTDIYSLGATLYELLTLEPVFASESRSGLLLQIVRDEPTAPRRLNRAVPAELETVVLKALAKNPAERYGTAQELAEDLRRFLDDKPVLARRPSPAERLRRWARRRRGVLGGIAVATLFAATCFAASGAMVCQQRDESELRRAQAMSAVDQLYTEFGEGWLARQPQLECEQALYLRRALTLYEDFAKADGCKPVVKLEAGRAQRRVADILVRLGEPDRADVAYAAALERLKALAHLLDARAEWGVVLNHRGHLRRARGRASEALRDYREAETLFEQIVAERPCDYGAMAGLAGSRVNIGLARQELQAFAEAEDAYRRALPLFEQCVTADPSQPNRRHDLAGCVNNLGLVLQDTNRTGHAEQAFARAASVWKSLIAEQPNFPPYRRAAATSLSNLGCIKAATGRLTEAETAFGEAQKLREQLATDFPKVVSYRQELAATLHGRGMALIKASNYGDAERILKLAFAQRHPLAAAFPGIATYQRDLAASHHAFGELLVAMGKPGAAEQAYRTALELREKLAGESPTPTFAAELLATRTALERLRATGVGGD